METEAVIAYQNLKVLCCIEAVQNSSIDVLPACTIDNPDADFEPQTRVRQAHRLTQAPLACSASLSSSNCS
jgi:hypothetical protein